MKKKIFSDIIVYGIGDFIVTGVSAFLFIPLYIKFLSQGEYGVFNILNNNTTIFTYIFQLGIISAFARIYFLRKEKGGEKKYIGNIILLHLVYSLFLFFIIFLFRKYIFYALAPSVKDFSLLLYPVAVSFLTFLPALYYIYLRVEKKPIIFVRYQVLNVCLISILILSTIYLKKFDLGNLLICFGVTNLIIWLLIIYRFSFLANISFDKEDIYQTIKFSFPIFISYIAYFFISKYSLIILQRHVRLETIGMFALAQQIGSIPSLITIAITKAVQPYIFSSSSKDELAKRASAFDDIFKTIMIWLIGSLIFFADILFGHLLPASYYPIHNTTKYILIVSLVYNFSIVENSILLYYMKSRIILMITVVGSLINVLLSNILVYQFSINGIVLSMLIAFLINFFLEIYFSRKFISIKYNIKKLVTGVGIIAFYIALASYGITDKHPISFAIFFFLALTVITGASIKRKQLYDIK